MIELQAPNYKSSESDFNRSLHFPKLFLAGGITGCPDWQREVIESLIDEDVIIFNPRRDYFDITDADQTQNQIEWEADHLSNADILCFWFCKDTVQPIVLFELGRYTWGNLNAHMPVIIGIEPGYPREQDVRIQVGIDYPDYVFQTSLSGMIESLKEEIEWFDKN